MKIANIDKLKTMAARAAEKYGIPGMDAALISGGKTVCRYVRGVVDADGNPVTEDTLYESASLTKALFATLFLRLADRGAVSLDEPAVAQGAPVWSDDPRFSTITPRQCLSHGTGLPNWSEKPMPFKFDPGTSYSYSGEGYYLLQHLVEAKLGKSWDAIMREEFFAPWNVPAEVIWTPEIGPRISNGFDENGKVCKIRDCVDNDPITGEPNAAWSLYSNPGIYGEFICRMMNDRCGLSERAFGEMLKVQNHAADGVDWGLGWGLTDGCAWHWGDDGGYKNFVVWDPETREGVVIFTNSDAGMPFYMELLGELTEGFSTEKVRKFILGAE